MRSALARLIRNQVPVPMAPANSGRMMNLTSIRNQPESLMRAYNVMATVWSCVQLYASAVGAVQWNLYRSQPQDARRRYAQTDTPVDQRVQVTQHPALSLISTPNPFFTRMQLFELDQTYLDLTGESYWVLERDAGLNYPTGIWAVRPDRMEPVTDPTRYLLGWMYTGPDGDQVPLGLNQVVQVRYPNPMDPFHGLGPVQSILTTVDAYRYSAEWNRNFFLNSAQPNGVVTLPGSWSDVEWKRFTDRWRETHRGVGRAHAVAVLEDGAQWTPAQMTVRDMDFTNLQNLSRDTVREAFRMHKVMTGVSDDVNRANAQTGEEVFASWGVVPRLERKKDMLNNVLLPMFGTAGKGVEFDYVTPVPANREEDRMQMLAKCQSAAALVNAGYDPHDALETVGLPDMDIAEKAVQAPALPPGWVPEMPGGAPAPTPGQTPPAATPDSGDMENRLRKMLSNGHMKVGV